MIVFADHTEDCIWLTGNSRLSWYRIRTSGVFRFRPTVANGPSSLYSAPQPVSPYLWEYRTAHSWVI